MEWWAPEFHWLYPQTCNMARNTPITPTRSHLLPPMGPSSHHISQTNPRTRMIRGDKCSAILPDQGRDQQYHVTVLSCSVRPWNCHTRLTAPAIDYHLVPKHLHLPPADTVVRLAHNILRAEITNVRTRAGPGGI